MRKQTRGISVAAILAFFLFACNSNSEKPETQVTQPATPELKSVFINGDSLHYIDIGKGEPVIFVHGTLDDYRLWQLQLDTFAKHYRVIAYSRRYAFPNRRVMNDSADYSPTIHGKDLVEFIKTLNAGPAHLVGHSYGAFTALLATMNNPELVKTLTLGEPPVMPLLQNVVGGDTIINNFMGRSLVPAASAFRSGNNEKGVSIFMSGVSGDTSLYSKLPQEVRDQMMENVFELRGIALAKNIFPPVSCDSLKKIKTPVLIMTGQNTLALFKAVNEELNKCLTNREKAILPNATHGLELENPVDFNKIVLTFIDKH